MLLWQAGPRRPCRIGLAERDVCDGTLGWLGREGKMRGRLREKAQRERDRERQGQRGAGGNADAMDAGTIEGETHLFAKNCLWENSGTVRFHEGCCCLMGKKNNNV